MQTAETYQGWTNYATWGAKLVLDNDQGPYMAIRDRLTEIHAESPTARQVKEGTWTEMEFIRFTFTDALKDFIEELCGLDADLDLPEPTLMARQLLQAALAEINYEEIAENIISE